MEVVTILVLLVLNIALPTLDMSTDIILVNKLYWGAHYCGYDAWSRDRDNYDKCRQDTVSYCRRRAGERSHGNNPFVCRFSSHPKMATAMLIPCLLNYIACFITFLRKEKNKKFTFIFALLPIYPQFGENNH